MASLSWRIHSYPISLFSSSIDRRRRSSLRIRAVQDEDIVIIGAGIAGLATAASLQRQGVRSLVLERGDTLRTGGTSLTLFKNAWRVLDSIGVADELRTQFLEIEGLAMMSKDGRVLRRFNFRDVDTSQEVRAVERKVLLEALASRLMPDSIRFSSKLKSLSRGDAAKNLLQLEDGTQIRAKVVIGCDGVGSSVAKWMGFSEPKFVGHCAFRGLGEYPEGHRLQATVSYIYGRGIRAGYVPVSHTKVYWFICFNSQDPGTRGREASLLKQDAAEMVAGWPSDLTDVILRTPDIGVLRTPLVDRWLWPGASPAGSSGSVVVAGDAWHPMTPNLGQGGCCALEDAAVLSAKLSDALADGTAMSSVAKALSDFCTERWWRVFPLTIRSHLVGSLLQWDNPLVCALRNEVVIPKLVALGPFLEHTNYRVDYSQIR